MPTQKSRKARAGFSFTLLFLSGLAAAQGSQGNLLALINGENQLAILNPETEEILARLPTGVGPHEVVVSHDGRFAYVVNSGAGPGGKPGSTVTAFDLRQRRVLATWEVGWFTQPHTPCTQPHGLALSRDGRHLWVTCAPQRVVFELDTATGKATRLWPTERDGSWMLAAAPDGSKLFVPNLEGKSLSVIDRGTNRVRVIELDESAMAIDVAPDGREVWLGGTTKVWILDSQSLERKGVIEMPRPMRVQFVPGAKEVVITTATGVSFVDAASREVTATIPLEGVPKGLLISPDGRHAFVGLVAGTEIAVIDLRTKKLLRKYSLGKTPEGLAWAN